LGASDEADLPQLLERVHAVPGVASAVYVSRADALRALKQRLQHGPHGGKR